MVKSKEDGSVDNAEMIKAIEGMTVLQLSELVKALEERFGEIGRASCRERV